MRKYGESKTPRIMMATVRYVTSSSGLRKFHADGFFFGQCACNLDTGKMALKAIGYKVVWIYLAQDGDRGCFEQGNEFRKNNQPDASISKIYFYHKTPHISAIFCAHHQGLSTVHTAIGTLPT
jgi:hypothetical protein